MAVNRALVTLHTADSNPANYITNSFWFDDFENPGTNLPLIADELIGRYNAFRPQMSQHLAQNGHEIQFYKQSDPEPRVPVYEETWNFSSAPAGATLPTEVSIVLSFQAARVSGLPQSRRRGRVYLGPLAVSTAVSGRPSAALLSAVVDFGETLLGASNAADWTWVVFSTVNGSAVPVTNGWVDNSYDTQRRRGVEWTSRETYGVT